MSDRSETFPFPEACSSSFIRTSKEILLKVSGARPCPIAPPVSVLTQSVSLPAAAAAAVTGASNPVRLPTAKPIEVDCGWLADRQSIEVG